MKCAEAAVVLLSTIGILATVSGETKANIKANIALIGNVNRAGEIAEKTNEEGCTRKQCTTMMHRIAVLEMMHSKSMRKMEAMEQKINVEKKKMEQTVSRVNKEINIIINNIKELLNRTSPVDGGYSSWSPYSFCDCGLQFRTRSCDTPAAQHGGKDCSAIGDSQEWRVCSKKTKCTVENLAVGKPATQSSTSTYRKAGLAVDGNLKTYSFTNTHIAWWRVEIGKHAVIYKVRVIADYHNFNDVRYNNVTIGNTVNVADMASCGIFKREGGKETPETYWAWDITCEKVLVGRYIQVTKYYGDEYYLFMLEFYAYGRYI